MKEKTLLQISIVCSLAGLVLLFFISRTIELPETNINTITIDDIGKNVKVCGTVSSKNVSKSQHVFLQVQDSSGSINVIAFNNMAEKLGAYDVKKNENICVTGLVDEYNSELEIIAKQKIERVD